jgi:hypothetical protein
MAKCPASSWSPNLNSKKAVEVLPAWLQSNGVGGCDRRKLSAPSFSYCLNHPWPLEPRESHRRVMRTGAPATAGVTARVSMVWDLSEG